MVSVCLPSDASGNTYHLTWISLTLGVGYLFMAAPAKHSLCSLPWMRGISLPSTTVPDLQRGIAPLGPLVPVQAPLLGLLLLAAGPGLGRGWLLPAATPGLGREIAPLG